MPHPTALQALQQTLLSHANPQKAQAMADYQRGQFAFIGLAAPERRALVKSLGWKKLPRTELLTLVQACWELPQREFQYVAVDLLAAHHKLLQTEDIALLLTLAQQRSWWDSVDGLAGVMGDLLFRLRSTDAGVMATMDAAIRHENFWVRRIAMLHQLGWREATDTQRLFDDALRLSHEKEFFIRKAIGWALRDYARTA
ncbi:DNA alkylation repair protein, partial [Undibacterium luofuense]|uniref:DNA alkylation repair protein n=1 Tax=Undibacterium luofuense TaxID=2828733 RepID=UPI0030EE2A1C